MADTNKTISAKLELQAQDAVAQLKSIANTLGNVKGLVDELSNSKLSFNVEVQNKGFNQVIELLNKRLAETEKNAKKLNESVNTLGKKKGGKGGSLADTFKEAQEAIKGINREAQRLPAVLQKAFDKAFNPKTANANSWTNKLKTIIADTISKGIEKGIEDGFKRKRGKGNISNRITQKSNETINDELDTYEGRKKAAQDLSTAGNNLNAAVNNLSQILGEFGKKVSLESSATADSAEATVNAAKSSREEMKGVVSEMDNVLSKGRELADLFGKNMANVTGEQFKAYYKSIADALGPEGAEVFQNLSPEDRANVLAKWAGIASGKHYTEKERMSKLLNEVTTQPARDAENELKEYRKDLYEKLFQEELKGIKRKNEYYDEKFKRLAQQEAERAQFAEVWQRTKPYTTEQVKRYDPLTQMRMQMNRAATRMFGLMGLVSDGQRVPQNKFSEAYQNLQNRGYDLNITKFAEKLGLPELLKNINATSQKNAQWNRTLQNTSTSLENFMNIFNDIQQKSANITRTVTGYIRQIFNYMSSTLRSTATSAAESFKKLEEAQIGFKNFFGAENVEGLMNQIKAAAVQAPGIEAADLADYVKQIAPLSNGSSGLALSASLGMLKTIQYGGANGASEMEYVIRNVRDVMAKGKATQIDLNQFNRAMPVLAKALASVGREDMIDKNGMLKITKNNAGDLMRAFAELNDSETSIVKDIFKDVNKTLNGQIQQFQEQFITSWNDMLEKTGVYGMFTKLLNTVNEGEYVTNGLARIAKYVNDKIIPWIKNHTISITKFGLRLWNGMKQIGEAIRDGAKSIMEALGVSDWRGLLNKAVSAITGIIRGFTNGINIVLKLVNGIASKFGVKNFEDLASMVGLLGSVFGKLLSGVGNLIKNSVRMFKGVYKDFTALRLEKMKQEAADLRNFLTAINPSQLGVVNVNASARADAISNIYRWRNKNVADGIVTAGSTVDTGQATVSAVQTLQQLVAKGTEQIVQAISLSGDKTVAAIRNDNLTEGLTDAQKEQLAFDQRRWSNLSESADRGLPTADMARVSKGRKIVYGISENGVPTVSTYDKNNKIVDQKGFSDQYDKNGNLVAKAGELAYAEFQQTVNKSTSALQKFATKFTKFSSNLMSGLTKAFAVTTFATTVSTTIESTKMFGDASETIANIIEGAGITISAALVGMSIGGTAGGIVGALVGLGIAAVNCANKMKEAENAVYNQKLTELMDDTQNAAYKGIADKLTESGLDSTTNAGTWALNELKERILKTPAADLTDPEVLKKLANETLKDYRWKLAGYDIEDYINSDKFEALYDPSKDISTSPNVDAEWRKRAAAVVTKYAADEGKGYYYDEQEQKYYQKDYNTGDKQWVSDQQVLEDVFGKGIKLSTNQVEELEKYATSAEEKIKTDFIDGIDTAINSEDGWLKELAETTNKILYAITIGQGELSPETAEALYGHNAAEQLKMWKDHGPGLGTKLGDDEKETYYNKYGSKYGVDMASGREELIRANKRGEQGVNVTGSLTGWGSDYGLLLGRDTNMAGYYKTLYEAIRNCTDEAEKGFLNDWLDALGKEKFSKAEDVYGFMQFWQTTYYQLYKKLMHFPKKNYATGGLVKPMGVDTINAMLSPGEFVLKPSAVAKSGLGALHALNRGDLPSAIRSLSAGLGRTWNTNHNMTDNSQHNKSTKVVNNRISIFNRTPSGRVSTYRNLANRLAG